MDVSLSRPLRRLFRRRPERRASEASPPTQGDWAAGSFKPSIPAWPTTSDAGQIAVLEIAAGHWARAFAAAEVGGLPAAFADALPPSTLAVVGRQFLERGEWVAVVHVDDAGAGSLFTASRGHYFIEGQTPAESTWEYVLTQPAPSGLVTSRLPAASVVHARLNVHGEEPWRGVPPWAGCRTTAALAGVVEERLASEASLPVGLLLDAGSAQGGNLNEHVLSGLTNQLNRMRGNLAVSGRANSPNQITRIGASLDESMVTLRGQVRTDLLSACGVPVGLVEPGASAGAQREAWRRFLHGSIAPAGRALEAELRRKLAAPELRVSFERLFASDITGRARAYASLVAAGMDGEAAEMAVGLDE